MKPYVKPTVTTLAPHPRALNVVANLRALLCQLRTAGLDTAVTVAETEKNHECCAEWELQCAIQHLCRVEALLYAEAHEVHATQAPGEA